MSRLSKWSESEGPHLVIVGGVHGAGKSSLCGELAEKSGWPWLTNQVVRSEHPEGEALSRTQVHGALQESVHQHFSLGHCFIFEHIMSGHYVERLINEARENKFSVHLVYIHLAGVELAMRRVDKRIREGGHDVEREKVALRLKESRRNFWELYRTLADSWELFDNSSDRRQLITSSNLDGSLEVHDTDVFEAFLSRLT